MNDFDQAIHNLTALTNVQRVTPGPDHLAVVVADPAPFDAIKKLTTGVGAVTIIVATMVDDKDAARFREATHAPQNAYDREGNPDPQLSGMRKGLAADIRITTPPTLSAMYGDALGLLFATVEDAEAWDRANARR